MVLPKSSENMLMEYQQDNAYLKRALDLQEQFITSLQQQIAELRNENTILNEKTIALQNENNNLCERSAALQNEKAVIYEQAEENLRNLRIEMQNNIAIIQSEKNSMDKQFHALRIENTELCREIKKLQENKCHLEQETVSLQNEQNLLIKALDGIQNSTIWKLTRPLRKILDFVKGR